MAGKEILRFSHVRTEEIDGVGLKDFNLSVFAGEIIYLTGIHGSGKHSVKGIFEGRQKQTGGRFYIEEELAGTMDKKKFQEQGIFVIDGSKSLNGNLSISENFFLLRQHKKGKLLYREKYAAYETGEILKKYGICCNPMEKVHSLNQCEQYLLSVAKAVSNAARVLLLDCLELSISLQEYGRLQEVLQTLKARGISTLVIDSVPNPLLEYADRAVVVYDGRDLKVVCGEQMTMDEMAGYLAGAPLGEERQETQRKEYKTAPEIMGILTGKGKTVIEVPRGGIVGLFDMERDTRVPFEDYMKTIIRNNVLNWEGTLLSACGLVCIPENGGDLLLDNMMPGDNLLLPSGRRLSGLLGRIPHGVREYVSSSFWKEIGIERTAIGELDRVERKILCIRRWILARARVLVMENPDMGLDSEGQRRVFSILREAAEAGILVCIMANNPFTLRTNCITILQLVEGRLNDALRLPTFS